MSFEFIDEVMVRDNSKCHNLINYGRYNLGNKAKNAWIYTQDDDCINHDLQKLYDAWEEEEGDHGIYHGGTQSYIDQQKNMTYGSKQACMVGWGAFFRKDWIKLLEKYTDKYGTDATFYRETDRILAILLNRHHRPILCKIEHLDAYNDKDIALCQQPGHIKSRELAIKRALAL